MPGFACFVVGSALGQIENRVTADRDRARHAVLFREVFRLIVLGVALRKGPRVSGVSRIAQRRQGLQVAKSADVIFCGRRILAASRQIVVVELLGLG